ncbi:RhoGAP-domain-containing protein [Coprinopsis marcescibilis]|uniref:RhoGAP-domain-containing protein n=1 Tax=Coprinopsis marcescibilis TaxID=230819 RepID=A0A5C3LCD8_COPMA|nr:RhoGAP-domain-containing protein [Coprinopsis marcescibilis]
MDTPQPVSARSSLSDQQSAVQGPIPLFDVHIRFISDSYLEFFQERKRIEENYVDSLKKLYRKIRSIDGQLNDRGDLSTTRSVWSEIVDSVERETQARQAFCTSLANEVITPLSMLKDTQERTRKRIKEDIKDSTDAYAEYAETVLPRLKGRYSKKFSEVEDQKRTSNMPPPSAPPGQAQFESGITEPGTAASSRPTVTGPQPLRALARRPSASAPRNRSPSSSGALSDLAHHGKKQLNQFIGGFLDKGGVKESLGGSRESQALRTVRAKREADEADKEYRKGIHWLETLRLRRTKILEGGYKSLEMFVEDCSTTLKKCLVKYTDHLTATCATQSQLSAHARSCVDRLSPEKDLLKLRSSIPRSLASAIPDPILYEHGQVGSCSDLIFGFGLTDYSTTKGLSDSEIPKIVKICIAEIDKRGLDSEGIYRVSGRHALVHALQHEIEKNESEFQFTPKDDIFAVASLLKLYLRELPEPLFKFAAQDRIQHTAGKAEHAANNFITLRSKIRRLPLVHQATLKALLEHLNRVVSRSEKNKMDPKNVAIVFGGVIFGEDEMPKGVDLLSMQTAKDSVMEDLIINVHKIFGDQDQAGLNSPPLPPTPVAEPPDPHYYGSKSTRVATVPPIDVSGSPQDFTPRLPARPGNSIHPSARAHSSSPTKQRVFPASSSEQFSTPPSPSDISSSLDVDKVIHSRSTSSGSSSSRDSKPPPSGSPQRNKFPFPTAPTPPEGSPAKQLPPPPTSDKDDPFR